MLVSLVQVLMAGDHEEEGCKHRHCVACYIVPGLGSGDRTSKNFRPTKLRGGGGGMNE